MNLYEQHHQWELLQFFLQFVKTELEMTCSPCEEILHKAVRNNSLHELEVLRWYEKSDKTDFRDKWDNSVEMVSDVSMRPILRQFGESFGASSCKSQQEKMDSLLYIVKEEICRQRTSLQKESQLSSSLGILCGIGAVILFL